MSSWTQYHHHHVSYPRWHRNHRNSAVVLHRHHNGLHGQNAWTRKAVDRRKNTVGHIGHNLLYVQCWTVGHNLPISDRSTSALLKSFKTGLLRCRQQCAVLPNSVRYAAVRMSNMQQVRGLRKNTVGYIDTTFGLFPTALTVIS